MSIDLELAKERTLLAAQRTTSAWIRTGLTGIGGGFAIIRLIPFRTEWHEVIASIIGQIFIIWGAFICLFALHDYQKVTKRLHTSHMPPAVPYKILTICLVAFICASLLFLITFRF